MDALLYTREFICQIRKCVKLIYVYLKLLVCCLFETGVVHFLTDPVCPGLSNKQRCNKVTKDNIPIQKIKHCQA